MALCLAIVPVIYSFLLGVFLIVRIPIGQTDNRMLILVSEATPESKLSHRHLVKNELVALTEFPFTGIFGDDYPASGARKPCVSSLSQYTPPSGCVLYSFASSHPERWCVPESPPGRFAGSYQIYRTVRYN